MKSQSQIVRVKRERFLPFRFAPNAIALTPEEIERDGTRLEWNPSSDRKLRLDEPWSRLRLRFRLSVDVTALARALPPDELGHVKATALLRWAVVIAAPDTRLRQVVTADWNGAPEVEFALEVSRVDVHGLVTFTPWLARGSATPAAPGFASAAGHRVASGASFLFQPEPEPIATGRFLEIRYQSFSHDAALRSTSQHLYVLDTVEAPLLWINSDHDAIADVLNAKGQTGTNARLREVLFDRISCGVWSQLFFSAIESLSASGEARAGWQSGVLAELLPLMYPKVSTHSARVQEVLALRQEQSLGQLAQLCDLALQRRDDIVRHMSRLIDQAQRGTSG